MFLILYFPDLSFSSFVGLLKAPTRKRPERVCDTIRTFPEKSEKPRVGSPPRFSFSKDLESLQIQLRYLPQIFHRPRGSVLRDTARLSQRYPPIACYGVFGVSTWPIGCNTPSPFLSFSPLESMRSVGAIPPHKRGISAILTRYPTKTRQKGAIPPSTILSRKGIAR